MTIFVHAIRSQIELNALLNKFILDSDYHKKHLKLNEDRSKKKQFETIINIHTLVAKLDDSLLPYNKIYNELSLLLHPNPSAIKFYAQAEGQPTPDKSGLFTPQIKHFFDETITPTNTHDAWFNWHVWFFLTSIEHFIILFDTLDNDFFIDDQEERAYIAVAWVNFFHAHNKEILSAANQAMSEGGDLTEKLEHIFNRGLSS